MLVGIEVEVLSYLTKAIFDVDVTAGADADSNTSSGIVVRPEFGQRAVEPGKRFILRNLLGNVRILRDSSVIAISPVGRPG